VRNHVLDRADPRPYTGLKPAHHRGATAARRVGRCPDSPRLPTPIRPPVHKLQHRPIAVTVGGVPARREPSHQRSSLDGDGAFVRVHADDHAAWFCAHLILRCSIHHWVCRAGRAPLLRAEQTPLEPLPAPRRRPTRAGQKSHTPCGAADVRATGRAPWTEAAGTVENLKRGAVAGAAGDAL
jgi:hypothetical protein